MAKLKQEAVILKNEQHRQDILRDWEAEEAREQAERAAREKERLQHQRWEKHISGIITGFFFLPVGGVVRQGQDEPGTSTGTH